MRLRLGRLETLMKPAPIIAPNSNKPVIPATDGRSHIRSVFVSLHDPYHICVKVRWEFLKIIQYVRARRPKTFNHRDITSFHEMEERKGAHYPVCAFCHQPYQESPYVTAISRTGKLLY